MSFSSFFTPVFHGLLADAIIGTGAAVWRHFSKHRTLEKKYRMAFEIAVCRFYADPAFAGNEAREHYTEYRKMLQSKAIQEDILASDNEVYKQLFDYFVEEVSKDFFLCGYTIIKVLFASQEQLDSISEDLKKVLREVRDYREGNSKDHKRLSDQITELRDIVKTSIVKDYETDPFNIETTMRIHLIKDPFFDEAGGTIETDIPWAEILKVVSPVLRKPHSETGIIDALEAKFPGIVKDDVMEIIDNLRSYGLADVIASKTEYDGVSEAWMFTERGWKAYDDAKDYHM